MITRELLQEAKKEHFGLKEIDWRLLPIFTQA
jgi:hypothetical protein